MVLEGIPKEELESLHDIVQAHIDVFNDTQSISRCTSSWYEGIKKGEFWEGLAAGKQSFFLEQYRLIRALLDDSPDALAAFLIVDWMNGRRAKNAETSRLDDAVRGYIGHSFIAYGTPGIKVKIFDHLAQIYRLNSSPGEDDPDVRVVRFSPMLVNNSLIYNPQYRFGLWLPDPRKPEKDSYRLRAVSED